MRVDVFTLLLPIQGVCFDTGKKRPPIIADSLEKTKPKAQAIAGRPVLGCMRAHEGLNATYPIGWP
jgi:hypothetical protein